MSLRGWQPLACECGSERFTSTHSYVSHTDQGITQRDEGAVCLECKKPANLGEMRQLMAIQNRLKELETTKAQLEKLTGKGRRKKVS